MDVKIFCWFLSLIKTLHLLKCNIIYMMPGIGCSKMLCISLITEKSLSPTPGACSPFLALGVFIGVGQTLQHGPRSRTDLAWVGPVMVCKQPDPTTRSSFLDYSLLTLSFEFPPSGGAFFYTSVDTVELYRYNAALGVVALVAEIICLIIIIVTIGQLVVLMIEQKWRFFIVATNIANCFIILFYFIALSFYIYRSVWTVKTVEEMMNNKG